MSSSPASVGYISYVHSLIEPTIASGFSEYTSGLMVVRVVTVVVTAYDSESGRPGSNPECRLIYYEAPITAQGLPEPSSLRGGTLGTRAAEHKSCNWACKLTDCCSLKSCVRPHLLAYATECKVNSTACSASVTWVKGRSISVSYIYILHLHSCELHVLRETARFLLIILTLPEPCIISLICIICANLIN